MFSLLQSVSGTNSTGGALGVQTLRALRPPSQSCNKQVPMLRQRIIGNRQRNGQVVAA